jgi:hypothetical protein
MSVCNDAMINMDWHFNVWARDDKLKKQSPLMAFALALQFVGYDQPHDHLITIGGMSWADIERLFFDTLRDGEGQPGHVIDGYIACRNTHSNLWDFGQMCFGAAAGTPSNLDEAGRNIAWQRAQKWPEEHTHGLSVAQADASWTLRRASQNADAKSFFTCAAMYYLLWGQHHNAGAMQCYRACFRDDRDGLFRLVSGRTLSPLEILETVPQLRA